MANRRKVLGVLGGTTVAMLGMPGLAFGAIPENVQKNDRRLVFVFLRGGMDALSAVPPYADPTYATQRGGLAVASPGNVNGALDLDGYFGLSPYLPEMHRMYTEKQLVVLHAIASPYRERSHFDAQNLIENGTTKPFGREVGWLNVALGISSTAMAQRTRSALGIAIGSSIPLVLRGQSQVASWSPSRFPQPDHDLLDRLALLYQGDALLNKSFDAARQTQSMMGGQQGAGLAQPMIELAKAAGEVLAKPIGPRVASIDFGGWDTHINQLGEYSQLTRNLRMLDGAVKTLRKALGEVWQSTAVMIVSEFGRAVAPNGSGGTDHGLGGVAFLAGGAVNGGRVIADWPGLSNQALYEGRDLRPTQDLRALFKSTLEAQLGITQQALETEVFPESRIVRPLQGLFR
jgi:uncharacterized protein (DUF1501 family)